MIGYCPLGSGSKGNSVFIRSQQTKLLVDAGLSARSLEERLSTLGTSLAEIDAVLITHEHGDHIRGLKQLSLQFHIPILANGSTAQAIATQLPFCPKFKIFTTGDSFTFRDITIRPFTVQHDTLDPVAFTLSFDNFKLGICTDLGHATHLVTDQLQGCNFLYVEANHEPSMVHASPRPLFLKQRILSRHGHLSNADCAELLCNIAHDGLKHVYLAHLSGECNSPEKALEVILERTRKKNFSLSVAVAPQEKAALPISFSSSSTST